MPVTSAAPLNSIEEVCRKDKTGAAADVFSSLGLRFWEDCRQGAPVAEASKAPVFYRFF